MRIALKAVVISGALCMSACSTISQAFIDQSIKDEAALYNAPDSWAMKTGDDSAVLSEWEAVIQDARFSSLFEEALRNNPSQISAARSVERADALLNQARSVLLPSLSVSASPSASSSLKGFSPVDFYGGRLVAGWEADIWGRNGDTIRATKFDKLAVSELYRNARQALIAQVARNYVFAIEANRQTALARETLADRESTYGIVKKRFDLGTVSKRELVLAESDVFLAEDSLRVALATEISSVQALQVLLGRYPDGNMDIPTTFPAIAQIIAAGRPADILRRRADIVQAEFGIRSAFAREDVAQKGRWPTVSLSSDLSSSVGDIFNFLDPTDMALSLGAGLADTLFDGGLADSRIEAAQADRDIALKDYGQTVLNAFADVEGRLNELNLIDQRYETGRKTAQAARETLRLAEIQYKEGTLDLIDVITFKQRSLQAERTLLTIERQRIDARIALYLALGGSDDEPVVGPVI